MKCETTNAVLTFVLGALVLLGVIFALRTVSLTHDFRALQMQAMRDNAVRMQIQSIYNDAVAYNQKRQDPQLTRILQPAQAKPATR